MIGRRLLHYEITGKLGEGGMGVVYKARDTHLDRIAAIKVLPPEKVADRERHRRFVREAKAASKLNHPNIVTIFDIADQDGVDFIAMEYVPGRSLAEMAAGRGLPLDEALDYAAQIADALAAAHESGIVHRDLKPGNVMVSEKGRVKLLDFGIAKLVEAGIGEDSATRSLETSADAVLGTPAYMAPEQVEGKAADARSDIFSFGALLYELLVGRRAFERPSVVSTLHAVAREEPPPLPGSLPAGVRDVVARCLRKNPGERFQTAAALKSALETSRPRGAVAPAATTPSIAVLPFANLSAEKDNEYFSDGLAEEIINALAQLPGLRVTARTSAFAFRGKEMDVCEIGAKLRVDHILEGSVRKAGDRIRVTAQLIKASDGYHLWSQRYDRAMTDVFAIQDEISGAIVEKLKVHLAGGRPIAKRRTPDIEAYHLFLRARHSAYRITGEGYAKGREYYGQAIALDPDYAEAYAGLAELHLGRAFWGFEIPREAVGEAKLLLGEALRCDDALAEAHSTLGVILGVADFDWRGAEREMARALELNPASPVVLWHYAYFFLQATGRLDEALSFMRRAVDLDPLSSFMNSLLGVILLIRRDWDLALVQLQRTVELDASYFQAQYMLGLAYARVGRIQEAVGSMQRACELSRDNLVAQGFLAWIHARAGNQKEARALIAELEAREVRYKSAYGIVAALCALGETEAALDWFEKGVELRDPQVISLARHGQVFDMIRPHPRFQAMLRKMNLA